MFAEFGHRIRKYVTEGNVTLPTFDPLHDLFN